MNAVRQVLSWSGGWRLGIGLLCVLPWVVGCEGCQTSDGTLGGDAGDAAAYRSRPTTPFPAGPNKNQQAVKPGHWFTASKSLQSNRQDERGRLAITAGTASQDADGNQLRRWQALTVTRPAVLPKGQEKRLDFRMLAPLPEGIDARQALLQSQLQARGGGLLYEGLPLTIRMLRPEQYFFVVVTSRPEQFVGLQNADWVSPPRDPKVFVNASRAVGFRVVFPSVDDLIPLPETMLDWTSTAYVLWDDVPLDQLTPNQQQALGDWVHWGGRLIVNGRYASETFAGSSLLEKLPIAPEKLVELEGAPFAAMLKQWAVAGDTTTQQQVKSAERVNSRVAVAGPLAEDAQPVSGTETLVAQRRVGAGQVVMTRFDLATDLIKNWRSRDSFFNGAILRRPPREYVNQPEKFPQLRFVGDGASYDGSASLNTSFRLLSRDGGIPIGEVAGAVASGSVGTESPADASVEIAAAAKPRPVVTASRVGGELQRWCRPGAISQAFGGLGAWTDDSPVAQVAIAALTEESGIEIPPPTFVIRSLAWYLALLVPVNYVVFRLLGRIEWAWFAVPVIAVVGAVWIARSARLDIGFTRLQNEVMVLEMQPGHDRAHATSFVALYSSLGTRYELTFETADAVALPVGIGEADPASETAELRFGDAEGPTLRNVSVASNRTRIMHTEQMLSAGGTIGLVPGMQEVRNASDLPLEQAIIIRRLVSGEIQYSGPAGLGPGSRLPLQFSSDSPELAAETPLSSRRLVTSLLEGEHLRPGDMQLIATVQAAPTKLEVAPAANQQNRDAVLVAHLRYADLPAAAPDRSLPEFPENREREETDPVENAFPP